MVDEACMRIALEEAAIAASEGEIPVGAVVARGGEILARTHNLCETRGLASEHAEMLAIREASERLGSWRLSDCTLYVTLEPCPMCAGCAIHARVGRIVFGARDPRAGACGSVVNLPSYPLESKPICEGGLYAEESLALLRSFFAKKRSTKREKQENNGL